MTSKAEQIRNRRKRKRTLSLDEIVDVALGIIDEEGVDAVSMRRVAAEFDTGPASLYAYVKNKQELFERVLDRVVEDGEVPEGAATWQDTVRGWAHNSRAVLAAHQDVAKLAFAYIPRGDSLVDGAETVMGAMIKGGVPPQVAAWTLDVMSLYVSADAYEGWLLGKRFNDGSGRAPEEVAEAELGEVGEQFKALPADRYPYMSKYGSLLMVGGSDERFEFGVNMLIAGFEAQIPSNHAD